MKKIIVFILSFLPIALISQTMQKQGINQNYTNNYWFYHDYINKAECFYFIDNDVDNSLYYYDKTFSSFNFIFVKDAVNALQIASFNDKPNEKYLIKGFENGLKLEHLKDIPVLKNVYTQLCNDTSILKKYAEARSKYLSTVDFDYLSLMYKKAIEDQINKHLSNYDQIKKEEINYWIKVIPIKGFPSSKLIGIEDANIFGEIGKPENDLDNYKLKFDENLSYFTVDNNILSSQFIIYILIHNQCAFAELEHLFKDLIKKGEIHPREVGLLYDNMFRLNVNSNVYRCDLNKYKGKGMFYLNRFCEYDNYLDWEKTDALRKEWGIVSLTVDKNKKYYEKEHGFKLFFGFWNCM